MLRVLVCDDSSVARILISRILDARDDLTVVGQAADGREAIALVQRLKPDVVTMDVHMPVMDGLTATREIMAHHPCPIVIISAQAEEDVELSIRGLAAGALTVLAKPAGPASPGFAGQAAALGQTVRLMGEIRVVARRTSTGARRVPSADSNPANPALRRAGPRSEVVAIASSTGGPQALARVLGGLPETFTLPVLIVQHMTEGFHRGLATWLDSVSSRTVRLAVDGEPISASTALIAPGGSHLAVRRDGRIALLDGEPIGGHRPSANVLFDSVAEAYGARSVGVILTGMGDDGADGLAALRRAGGLVIAQDKATSIVYGMPGVAVARGLADHVVALDEVAGVIASDCGQVTRSREELRRAR
jgi:two-component system chemotaxis response regulator CheB